MAETVTRNGWLAALIRFCLEQKLVVVLAVVLLTGWGAAVAPFDWELGGLGAMRDEAGGGVAVDAIPNLGENQQIVFTEWPGRSPQDVEDQVTYPLTTTLMGVPGVKEVRSRSLMGFSSVYVIFNDGVDFDWSRTRLLEKLSALPEDLLPEGARPRLGPDATALGQIYWYTLEGRDPDGEPTGGWDLDELRSVQDWYVRPGLTAAEGVSEVASIGGYEREHLVEVDPSALRGRDVTLEQVAEAVASSNVEVGAGATEINRVEYLVRGRGYVEGAEDIEQAAVRTEEPGVAVTVGDVANVGVGPAQRRGALTIGGAEAVGGVVVVREGYNPLQAIENVKEQAAEISDGLGAKAVVDWSATDREQLERVAALWDFEPFTDDGALNHEGWVQWMRSVDRALWPEWVTLSELQIVPFYDRTDLIYETLGTLNDALVQQILVTLIVVVVLVVHLRASMLIGAMLPLAVLMCFIAMKAAGVEANVVALAGIAIAIGTIVDMGMIVTENVLRHLEEADENESRLEVVHRATVEVGGAVMTALATTIVSFLPVFALTGAAGKMFTPLAYTKTFVLIAAGAIALTVIPAAAHVLLAGRISAKRGRQAVWAVLAMLGLVAAAVGASRGWVMVWPAGLGMTAVAAYHIAADWLDGGRWHRWGGWFANAVAAALGVWALAWVWEPLGVEPGLVGNLVFVVVIIGSLLLAFRLMMVVYVPVLRWCLRHKLLFLALPALMVLAGVAAWQGFEVMMLWALPPAALAAVLGVGYAGWLLGRWVRHELGLELGRWGGRGVAAGWAAVIVLVVGGVVWVTAWGHANVDTLREDATWAWGAEQWPGLGYDDRVRFDEGSFLWMPTTSVHASIGEALDVLQHQDRAIASVPEVKQVVGKIGRVDSALDPAPVSMIETVIDYHSEYVTDDAGRRVRFRYDEEADAFVRDEQGRLIPDEAGRPFRQWRDHIQSPADIWDELAEAAALPGTTGAPPLQPIETRQVMLQTGMRGRMGVKVRAEDLESLDEAVVAIERALEDVSAVRPGSVSADRVVGKPYLEVEVDREAAARHGLNVADVNGALATAVGGRVVTRTVEGRQRYAVRVRYPRELRDDVEAMENVLIPRKVQRTASGEAVVPLGDVAEVVYRRGPQMIKSEDTFPVGYVTFGPADGQGALEVVQQAEAALRQQAEEGHLQLPTGVSFRFAGEFENQLAMMQRLQVVIPLSLGIIFVLLYFQFRSIVTAGIVFSGIAVAWAGGFVMIELWGWERFADVNIFGANLRDVFGMGPIHLTGAVWVGFLALFGIAVDDGVVMSTYLRQRFERDRPGSIAAIREATVEAGRRRVRPCLMTSATTILALLPVLSSTGRGADVMIPMAIPSVGGMSFVLVTMFTVPVLYCLAAEVKWGLRQGTRHAEMTPEPTPGAGQ